MSQKTYLLNKKANLYNLKAFFTDDREWDLNILAVDITWVFCWFDSTNAKDIESMSIDLVRKDFCDVEDDFGARGI